MAIAALQEQRREIESLKAEVKELRGELVTRKRSVALCVSPRTARGDDVRGSPVPEPIFTETVTDIDGLDPGEFEFELNGSELRALRGRGVRCSVQHRREWLATRRLGLRLEPIFSHGVELPGSNAHNSFAGGAGASWKLLQDFRRDIFVQAEVAARLPWNVSSTVDPGESALPFVFDVRGAIRRGPLTLRGAIGAAAGGESAFFPVRGGLAVLTGFGSSDRYGFWGIEADIDGTRQRPTVLALNLVPQLGPVGLPFQLGLAIPWVVGAGREQASTGIFIRILFESAREYSETRE